MTTQKTICLYLLVAYAIIIPICGVVLILYFLGITLQSTIFGFITIAIGGLSTAFAGSLVAKKSGKISSYKEIIKDFFYFRQSIIYYLIPIMFLLIIFGSRIFQGQLREGQYWSTIPRLFIAAILFGGVEEIGWRYIFQPALEKKFSFITSSVITFILWSIWHMMYNVLDGTVFSMQTGDIVGLLLGLLCASFILGSIYNITKSLWLCVFYHAILNAFSQVFIAPTTFGFVLIIIISITLSIVFVLFKKMFIKS